MPLLAALATAGYYEERKWGERYGQQAIDALADMVGLTLAGRLRPFLGNTPALLLGMLVAFVRFTLVPREQRRYSFSNVIVQLIAVVTTLTGLASCALDVQRAEHVARTLAPFLNWPARLTPAGIAEFCQALKEIGRENQAAALAVWQKQTLRFQNPRWYPTLPWNARPLYVGGLWFARGVFEAFRDGRGALEAADELERTGLKLYRMIASEVRMLYHANRGELAQARQHRERVELHAIQIGSASQVELWEPAAMILVYTTIGDVIEMRRVAGRLTAFAREVPSLARYAELAELAIEFTELDRGADEQSAQELTAAVDRLVLRQHERIDRIEPRSFIGWGALWGYYARMLNIVGRHADARDACLRTLAHLGPEDRPFVALFLNLELELAVAEAGLGEHDAARGRLDELLAYHAASDNPLTRGRLHEAYTRVSALTQNWKSYRHHLEQTRSWYRGTGTPALISRVTALEALEPRVSDRPRASDRPRVSDRPRASERPRTSDRPSSTTFERTRTAPTRSVPTTSTVTSEQTVEVATVVLPVGGSRNTQN
jgi:hypothetical protein